MMLGSGSAPEMLPRQADDDGGAGLGRLVTLTHAIPDALATEAPNIVSSSISSSEIIEIIVSSTTAAAPPSSSLPSIPELELSSSTLRTSTLANTAEPFTTSAEALLTTSISPLDPTAEPELEPQGDSEGDEQRVPAVGITFGALAGAGMLIGAAVALYRYKQRRKGEGASGQGLDKRNFRKMEG